jgi:hypothetical protein
MMDHCTRIFHFYLCFSAKGAGLGGIDGVERDWSLGRRYHESVFVVYTMGRPILNEKIHTFFPGRESFQVYLIFN